MRILVGLTPATSGTATVIGRRFTDLANPGMEVGVLLDASAQHAGRTGRETLDVVAHLTCVPVPLAEVVDGDHGRDLPDGVVAAGRARVGRE